MKIKFIKVEETLETRGNRPNPADRRVPRAVTGHVVTPSRGKVGVDDDPANPTELLKAMVRRNAKAADKRAKAAEAAKAAAAKQNASTEIFGNKIVEGFNDLLEGFSASGLEAAAIRRGAKRVPGGYTIPRKPGQGGLPHELAVGGGKFSLSLSRGGKGRKGRKRRNGEKVVESPRNDSSTEIFGNKIVEGFNDLLEKTYSASGIETAAKNRQDSQQTGGYDPQSGENVFSTRVPRERGGTYVTPTTRGGRKGVVVKKEGIKGNPLYRFVPERSSTEILGNKIVEGFNRLLSEALKTPEELAAEKAKYASETVPKSIGIAQSKGPAAAKEIGKKVLKSVVRKVKPLTPRPGETPEETEQRGKRIASKRGLLASELPGKVGVSRSDVFTKPRPPRN